MSSVKIVSSRGKEFILEQKSVAHIDPKNCVNCNECREICPVGAIEEYQRVICHACPSCTDIPGISPKKFVALATEKSCTTACPLGISPQGYVNLIRHDKANEAYELVWKKIRYHQYADISATIPVNRAVSVESWWIIRFKSEN